EETTMKENDLRYYKAIGKIHSAITSAASFDAAISAALKVVLENSMASYAVIWRADKSEKTVLRPMYWIAPADLSSLSCEVGEGLVGRVYESKTTETVSDGKNTVKLAFSCDVAGIISDSVTCVPLNSGNNGYGCVEFIKAEGSGAFTSDEIDTCELLTLMAEVEIAEEMPLTDYAARENVLLSVRNVHKYYQSGETKSHVLKGVNLDVYEGEFLCLLGESGCGKSTMLNIIGGLLDFDDGSVSFRGKDISSFNSRELTAYRRDHIGFIFLSYNLMPNLIAKQNVDLIGELAKDPADSSELLRLVGLGDKEDRYPSELSGGQQQRIAIARAMVKKPMLILADEPTAALDYSTSIEVLSVMENVVKQGTTLILITHNEEIAKMADRVIRFRDGKTYEVKINARPLHATDLVW
ncbi:MAG: ATP-binding cassette domain-containing protein, partial [Clostridiales bacterium]|nr:ATP-binding cassette domain-containing protein [Clostridiales bacterium]